MNPESIKRVMAEMFSEWKAEEEAKKNFDLEMSNWCGNNI